MRKVPNQEAELAQLFDIVRIDGDTGIGPVVVEKIDDINVSLFLLICKYSREYATLVSTQIPEVPTISREDFGERRRTLFHKLAGQYNAALRLLQLEIPLDSAVFESVIVDDMARKGIFEAFQKGELSAKDYLSADNVRISEVLQLYGAKILHMKEAGKVIDDQSSLCT